jgi:F420-dependent oxidoreductase-like protein
MTAPTSPTSPTSSTSATSSPGPASLGSASPPAHSLRFSIWPSTHRSWDEILDLTRHGEATGWDGVYFADHFMPHGGFTPDVDQTLPLDGDTLECWSVIAALAASVPRLRIGTLVSSVTYRHPAVLANAAAAVDHISHGRLLLGIGAGWQLNEHVAYGLDLGGVAERLDRFEEACQVIRSLLHERRTTVAGRHYRVTDAPNQPVPVQRPLPMLIGGAGERRTMRIAARYADEWNCWSTPEVLAHKVRVLHEHCEALGRDPAEVRVSTQAVLLMSSDDAWLADQRSRAAGPTIVGSVQEVTDIVGRYRQAGAGELIIPDTTLGPVAARKELYDQFMEEVAVHFRS